MSKLVALVAALVFAAPAAAACRPYHATANDAATAPAGPFVGVQDVTIGKTHYANVPAVTNVLAPLTPVGSGGVLTTTTSHSIALPTGTITTIDDATLVPTATPGVYSLVNRLTITGGGSGHLVLLATVDLTALTATGVVVGAICS
jgi:hypothetical protein